MLEHLVTWQYNGSKTTIDEFRNLDQEAQQDVIDFIRDFSIYEEITIDHTLYLLVHAGLGNFSPEKHIEDYSLRELVWERTDYKAKYFDDIYVVTGHTPTQQIAGNPRPGYIYRANHNIAIDCGACFPGGGGFRQYVLIRARNFILTDIRRHNNKNIEKITHKRSKIIMGDTFVTKTIADLQIRRLPVADQFLFVAIRAISRYSDGVFPQM